MVVPDFQEFTGLWTQGPAGWSFAIPAGSTRLRCLRVVQTIGKRHFLPAPLVAAALGRILGLRFLWNWSLFYGCSLGSNSDVVCGSKMIGLW